MNKTEETKCNGLCVPNFKLIHPDCPKHIVRKLSCYCLGDIEGHLQTVNHVVTEKVESEVTDWEHQTGELAEYLSKRPHINCIPKKELRGLLKEDKKIINDDYDEPYCETCDTTLSDEKLCKCDVRNQLRKEIKDKLDL